MQRLRRDVRWHPEALEKVSVDMQRRDPHRGALIDENFQEGDVLHPAERQEPRTRAPHSIAIRRADWLRYASTTGCPKCIHARDHGWDQAGGPHNTECVERFRRAFKDTEDWKKRLTDADLGRDKHLAKQMEDADKALE